MTPPLIRLRPGPVLLVLFVIVVLLPMTTSGMGVTITNPVSPYYASDSVTRLFDNFEGVTLAESVSASIGYESGYMGGRALALRDTGAHATFSDSWWADNGSSYQESGTIEFFYRPETYIFTGAKPHGLILTIGERPISPTIIGRPNIGIFQEGSPFWAISRQAAGTTYNQAISNRQLNPGQWYHFAVTWNAVTMTLFINDTAVATAAADSFFVDVDTFLLGATGLLASTQGLAARGRVDRLRLSTRTRASGEFPQALQALITSPAGGEILTPPFPVAYAAFSSDTRTRVVDLYADTDDQGFNGTRFAQNLVESGTTLTGAGLADGTYQLYAVARASDGDSAFYYITTTVNIANTATSGTVTDPSETAATVVPPLTTTDSFVTVLLNENRTTSGSLITAANSSGAGANYSVSTRLSDAADSAVIYIWTNQSSGAILLGLRSDTTTLGAQGFPLGIMTTDLGRRAFAATVLSTEFMDSTGRLIGDTRSTSSIGDSFVYTIEYRLSAATAALYSDMGFNIAAGSNSFSFYFADTYGAKWTEDTFVTTTVEAGSNGGIVVRVAGIRRDLPGGLGAASPFMISIRSQSDVGFCAIEAAHPPARIIAMLRGVRDRMLGSWLGRLLAALYYFMCGLV